MCKDEILFKCVENENVKTAYEWLVKEKGRDYEDIEDIYEMMHLQIPLIEVVIKCYDTEYTYIETL